jgi:F1F0 ATPase subunit 2
MAEYGSWVLVWAAALLAGGTLGTVFFAGLWWTVRVGASSLTPARWFVGSLVLRSAIVLSGLYLIARHHPDQLVPCLLGFVLARAVVLRATRTRGGAAASATGLPPCA